jgi:CheY-like chemotaxis protein
MKGELLEEITNIREKRNFQTQMDTLSADAHPRSQSALICESDSAAADTISTVLRKLGYSVDPASTTTEALKKIESNDYRLVTLDLSFPDDKEGGKKIIGKINGKKPMLRREMFVVLISAAVKSDDANAAFFNGVNLTVNRSEIAGLGGLVRSGQTHFQQIYRTFNRLLAEKYERG